ncbi:MAG: hypothetical protein ABWZ66_02135 [Pyrinomonadaceae bacterium]
MPEEYTEPTAKDRRRAARHIAALMNNPATPASLADAITEELDFYNEFLDYTNPKIVETSILAFEKAFERGDVEIFKERAEKLIG